MSILSQPYFRSEQAALSKLEALIWPHGPICLHCGATTRIGNVVGKGARPGLKFCCRCRKQFRATMGTVFEGSHVPIHKWFQACYLLTASDAGISAHQLHLRLEITNKTSLGMVHRLAGIVRRGGVLATPASQAGREPENADRFPRVRWRRQAHRNRRLTAGGLRSVADGSETENLPWVMLPTGATRQYLNFVETAQELGCRDDEAAFERVLAHIARHPAQTQRPRILIATRAGAEIDLAAPEEPEEIATVRIKLRGSHPAIWRQIEVPTAITLKGLHDIVQAAMGWLDYHSWEFTVDRRRYGLPMGEDWGTPPRGNAGKVGLREVLKPHRTTIDYLYDFGDCWEHLLTVSGIRLGEPGLVYPRFVVGERNAPPEDCGGMPGFYETLEAAADPAHENHAEAKQRLHDYDPDTLDELPIKYALGRIAARRKAARAGLGMKPSPG